jgi:CO/xanthine dehydrogenase FAD-binding subunit
MRAYVPSYQLISPASLGEALDALARDKGTWKPFAGGTDLMVLLEAGKLPHQNYVNIWSLKELRGIEVRDDFVTLGALTTYTEVQEHPVLRAEFPDALPGREGNRRHRDSESRDAREETSLTRRLPADSPPALLAYDAEIVLISKQGERTIPYSRFHIGYKQMDIAPTNYCGRFGCREPTNR